MANACVITAPGSLQKLRGFSHYRFQADFVEHLGGPCASLETLTRLRTTQACGASSPTHIPELIMPGTAVLGPVTEETIDNHTWDTPWFSVFVPWLQLHSPNFTKSLRMISPQTFHNLWHCLSMSLLRRIFQMALQILAPSLESARPYL